MEWSYALAGRSGMGAAGMAPLSYTTIRDWSVLTGNCPTAEEVGALLELDAALLLPDPETEAKP